MQIADKWLYRYEVGFSLLPSDLWDKVSGLRYRTALDPFTGDERLYVLHLVGRFLGEGIGDE